MIHTTQLENLIFNMHKETECDELIIISGFIGPAPLLRLKELPVNTKAVYGMYPEELIHSRLHNVFHTMHSSTHEILYSNLPVHSKLYVWRLRGQAVYALSGSANFTTRGLTVPGREILTEVQRGHLEELSTYTDNVLSGSAACDSISINTSGDGVISPVFAVSNAVCDMTLYDPSTGEVPSKSGLNWGNSSGNTNPGDSYISIRTSYVRQHPNLFPPRQKVRQPAELIWDDGTVMEGLFEGSQPVSGISFPKQISSFRDKNLMGAYLRKRLGLGPTATVRKKDLDCYGRDCVSISLLRNGIYFLDFSV